MCDKWLLQLIEDNPRRGSQELTQALQYHRDTIASHLHHLSTWSYGARMPHDLIGSQLLVRRDVCINFLTSRRNLSLLVNLVTGDEKASLRISHTEAPVVRMWRIWNTNSIAPEPKLHT